MAAKARMAAKATWLQRPRGAAKAAGKKCIKNF